MIITIFPQIQPRSQIKPGLELNPGQLTHPNVFKSRFQPGWLWTMKLIKSPGLKLRIYGTQLLVKKITNFEKRFYEISASYIYLQMTFLILVKWCRLRIPSERNESPLHFKQAIFHTVFSTHLSWWNIAAWEPCCRCLLLGYWCWNPGDVICLH